MRNRRADDDGLSKVTTHPRRIAIVGGGASGVLAAVNILADRSADVRVTLVEKTTRIGRGLAYSASHREHRVNVPARGMSAFADRPSHFLDWLRARDAGIPEDGWIFVPRARYGAYLADILETARREDPGRLEIVNAEARNLVEMDDEVTVTLADGRTIAADVAILAVGHETQPARSRGIAVRLGSAADTPLPREARVMVLGSGLSMVDTWLALSHADHRGEILVVSRNGLVPKSHRDVGPVTIAETEIPLGDSLTRLMVWFRTRVASVEAEGGDWRSVVDGLRPYNQRIWQTWSLSTRRRFLRHLRPWWNIIRHRLPPDLHDRLTDAIRRGQVRLLAAEFLGVERDGDAVVATIRPRAGGGARRLEVDRVYDCGGVSVDVLASSNPVVVSLVGRGDARPDRLNIGLDVSDDCTVIDGGGNASTRLYVVGPLTRGRFFEIEAIPDIRRQAEAVARRVIAR